MKFNISLIITAIIYNLVNFLFWANIEHAQNATSMVYLLIYPTYWLFTLVIVGVLAYKNRVHWFSKALIISTIVALFFCTPLPFLLFRASEAPAVYMVSSGSSEYENYVLKSETWAYRSGVTQVTKYYKAYRDCKTCDMSPFLPDSVWVFRDKNRDTLRVETYEKGKLVKLDSKKH